MPDNYTHPCSGQEEMLYLYLDDALSPQEATELRQHLQTCQTCQAQLAEIEALFLKLDQLEPVPLDAETIALASAEIMQGLPATPASSRTFIGRYGILIVQLVIGLPLLLLMLPDVLSRVQGALTASVNFNRDRLWQTVTQETQTFQTLLARLTALTESLSWQSNFASWDVSMDVIIVTSLVFGLAWLISNTVLLAGTSHSLKDGGSS
ncbi:MAG: zf-HC2 domain-containing protein [Chloroflexota bacterium]